MTPDTVELGRLFDKLARLEVEWLTATFNASAEAEALKVTYDEVFQQALALLPYVTPAQMRELGRMKGAGK